MLAWLGQFGGARQAATRQWQIADSKFDCWHFIGAVCPKYWQGEAPEKPEKDTRATDYSPPKSSEMPIDAPSRN